MGYHPRKEDKDRACLTTSRCRNSELWFVNNVPLEHAILGYVAKYSERYKVEQYALAIEGSHTHQAQQFPGENRSDYMRDLNSSVARAVPRYTPHHPGGGVFGRRFSAEELPAAPDLEYYFFYIALQPVQDGLVEKLSEYEGYHFFHDAIWGIKRKYPVVNWKAYNAARKRNPHARIRDYIEEHTLEYKRLPGYEHLSQREYALLMQKKLEEKRLEIVKERRAKGLGFLGKERLRQIRQGAPALNPKTSTRYSHRPRVLAICPVRRAEAKARYFDFYFRYKSSSKRYRAGDLTVQFPPGSYKPSVRTAVLSP